MNADCFVLWGAGGYLIKAVCWCEVSEAAQPRAGRAQYAFMHVAHVVSQNNTCHEPAREKANVMEIATVRAGWWFWMAERVRQLLDLTGWFFCNSLRQVPTPKKGLLGNQGPLPSLPAA